MAEEYTADSIQVLDELEAVRMRPGMYVGSTGSKGVRALVGGALSLAVAEHRAGHTSCIEVQLLSDGSWVVTDDGRGLPVDEAPDWVERAFGSLFGVLWSTEVGTYGVDPGVINGLSAALRVVVQRGGRTYVQSFRRGKALAPLLDVGPAARRGTSLHFLPDPDIFGVAGEVGMAELVRDLVFLNPGLQIVWNGQRTCEPNGLAAAVHHLASGPVTDVVHVHREIGVARVVAAVGLGSGGVHVWGNGIRQSPDAAVVDAAKEVVGPLTRVVAVSVELPETRYESRAHMNDPEAVTAVRQVLYDVLNDWP